MIRRHPSASLVGCLLFSIGALGCGGSDPAAVSGSDTSQTGGDVAQTNNAPPVARIDRPKDGDIVPSGVPVTFTGGVTDDRDAPGALRVVWTSDRRVEPLFDGPPNSLGTMTFDVGDLAPGDHVITMAVTDSGGLVGSASVTLTLNQGADAPEVAITPAAPTTADALTAAVTRDAHDPNRASTALTYSYAWSVDGAAVADLRGTTVPAARTNRGQRWEVRVHANDGLVDGADGTASVTIGNSPPSCAGATLLPSSGDTTTEFSCRCDGRADVDGDPASDRCAWKDGATPLDTGGACTLPAARTEKGMELHCELTPNDGEDDGAVAVSATVTVLNAPPSAPTATLGPEPADATTELTCALGTAATDVDGDSLQLEVAWLVDGHLDPGATTASVVAGALTTSAGTSARRGNAVSCQLRATDGDARSAPGESAPIVLGNAAPTVDTVAVTLAPGSARKDETATFRCLAADTGDADGDALTLTYVWYVGDTVVAGVTGQNLTGDDFARGDSIACAIVVDDGQGGVVTSETSKTVVIIGNALPSLAGAALSPLSVGANGQLTCTPLGWADPDGDAVEVSYAWFRQDGATLTVIAGQTGGTLTPDMLAAGDHVVCQVTPRNGADAGAPVLSEAATITAPEPRAPVVVVAAPDGAHGAVRCDFVTPAQHFPGAVTYQYYWSINGGAENPGGVVLSGATDCDLVRCRAVATSGATTLSSAPASLALPIGDDCATGDVCRPPVCAAGGGCDFALASDLPCDDGDACTSDDACDVGFCVAQGFADSGAACDDGLYCTGADVCDGVGTCRGGADPCARPASSCLVGSCDEVGDSCLVAPKDADTTCNDNNGCTTGDRCSAGGVCLPGAAVDCGASGDECNAGTCVSLGPNDHSCDSAPRPEGVTCTSSDFCTIGATCDGHGGCGGGTPRNCQAEAGDQCNSAVCDTIQGRCLRSPMPQNAPCNDADECTLVDRCSNGTCVGSSNACVAERLNWVDGGAQRPNVLPLGFGRYVTMWWKTADPDVFLRLSDARGGRENDEVALNSGGRPLSWYGSLATVPGGDFGVGHWHAPTLASLTYAGLCTNPDARTTTGKVSGRAFDYRGDLLTSQDMFVANMKVWSCESLKSEINIAAARMFALPIGSGFGFVVANDTTVTGNAQERYEYAVPPRSVLFYPPTGLMTVGPPTVLQDDAGADRIEVGAAVDAKPCIDGSGGFLVAWVTRGGDRILVRRYTAGGQRDHGAANLIIMPTPNGEPLRDVRVAGFHDGSVIIAWDQESVAHGKEVWFRRWDKDGGLIAGGASIQINTQLAGDQRIGDVSVFSDDSFVFTWDDAQGDASGYGVKARLFNSAGAPRGPELAVNTVVAGAQYLPTVAVLDTDEWVVAFVDDAENVYTRRYLASGKAAVGALDWQLNATTSGNQKNVAAARGGSGQVLAVYESPFAGQSKSRILGRLINPAGATPALGAELSLNQTGNGKLSNPDVAAGPASYVVAWQATGLDAATGEGVYVRVFDGAGAPTTGDILVNQTTTGNQSNPAVAVASDGSFVVVWQGPVPATGSGTVGFYRVFGADGAAQTGELLVVDAGNGVQRYLDVTMGLDDEAVIAWSDAASPNAPYLQKISLLGERLESWTLSRGYIRRSPAVTVSADGTSGMLCYEKEISTNQYALGCQPFDWDTLELLGDEVITPAKLSSEPQYSVAVAPLASGRAVAAWQTSSFYTDGAGVKAVVLERNAEMLGPDIVATRQIAGEQLHPEIVSLGGSSALVLWEDDTRDGSGKGVYFRVLTGL